MSYLKGAALAAVASWGLIGACAFSSVNRVNFDRYSNQYQMEGTANLPVPAATDAAKSTLEAMGYDIQSVTPELGTILTKNVAVLTPATCDCGSWNGSPVSGTATSAFKVTVAPGPDAATSRVAIEHLCMTTFNGHNLYGATTRHEVYRCASRGGPERDFWDKFQRIMAAREAKSTKQ
ncbi:MAG TPA: hypothetical protein VIE43_12715 [Thermoanaerobaculia bacterium]|jgi:hypothetical protein|nr:hypothetical protein [Thermoanaerobaculia bacterium]